METALIVTVAVLVVAAPALAGWLLILYRDYKHRDDDYYRLTKERARMKKHADTYYGGAGTFDSWDGGSE